MRIFLGMSEIAGMMTFISRGFKECGHEVTTCTDNFGSTFYNYHYDIVINDLPFKNISSNRVVKKIQQKVNDAAEFNKRKMVFRRHRDRHDVYIFMWNGFYRNNVQDYLYLKNNGKKIISLFLGSDVRHVSAFTQEYNLDTTTWENWFHSTDLNEQLFRLRKAELFSDAIYSVPDQAGLAIRPYHKIYIPFDLKPFNFHIPGRAVPKIVHIPSRSGIKGTSFILKTVNELKDEGLSLEFEFLTHLPNKEVINKLSDADILVDELFLHGPGTLSLEAIACGCAVATKTMKDEIFDSVLCNVDFDNLKEKLRKLITDIEFRRSVVVKSYDVIKHINDPVRIVNDFLDKIRETGQDMTAYDYYPAFFSEKYILPEGKRIDKHNRWLTNEIIKTYHLDSQLNIPRMKAQNLI